MEERTWDVAVVGGGPAGSAAAIRAASLGARVLLLERGRLPRQKVCGEFVSPESLRLLESLLGGTALLASAPRITQARLFVGTALLRARISPGAASISRYELDGALWKAAQDAGVTCRQATAVESVVFARAGFQLALAGSTDGAAGFLVEAKSVIDASGRWSNLQTARQLPAETWVGLKAHFDAEEETGSVDLFFFPEGYCGVQPAGAGRLNVCAMVRGAAGFRNSLQRVFAAHPGLWRRSREWSPAMETIATAPLFFCPPQALRNTVLLAGDAAGFVDPFVGDGISLALRSGVLAAESLAQHGWSADRGSVAYAAAYRKHFLRVFRTAARLRRMLHLPAPLRGAVSVLGRLPGVAEYALRSTRLRSTPAAMLSDI